MKLLLFILFFPIYSWGADGGEDSKTPSTPKFCPDLQLPPFHHPGPKKPSTPRPAEAPLFKDAHPPKEREK